MRPCDTVETAECWELALKAARPTVLALTRQNLPTLRTRHSDANLAGMGGYVLEEADGKRQATIIATGSEVSIAVEARNKLKAQGVNAAVVSLPCWELFDAQPESYRKAVLGDAPRIALEAAVKFGWEKYLGEKGTFIGMSGFGASAPAPELYKHFGITADAVIAAVKARI
jgi:transketolase